SSKSIRPPQTSSRSHHAAGGDAPCTIDCEIASFGRAVRARRYDDIIDTQGLVRAAIMARLARGRRLIHLIEPPAHACRPTPVVFTACVRTSFCTSVNVAELDLLRLPSLIICRQFDALYRA